MNTIDSDDLNWQDYEQLVRDIHEVLGREDGVEIICWGSACRVTGNSGTEHQIDVLTRHRAALYDYLTAIECKYWNKRVGKGNIATFCGVLEDINVDKGVVVSKMGFTDPAKRYAASMNIGLIELRKPVDDDWEGRVKDIVGQITVEFPPELYDFRVQLDTVRNDTDEDEIGESLKLPLPLDQIIVRIPGENSKTLHQLSTEEYTNSPANTEYTLNLPDGSSIHIPDFPEVSPHESYIRSVSFRIRHLAPMTAEINIRGDDRIFMIMKNIFDDREFTISSDGSITERE